MAQLLYQPDATAVANSQMQQFMARVNEKHNLKLENYAQLHAWSVEKLEDFWAEMFDFAGIIHSEPFTTVMAERKMPQNKWFEGAKLNFAENLLRHNNDNEALVFSSEGTMRRSVTYAQLNSSVRSLASFMVSKGLKEGERVCAFMPNVPETIMAMLAATSQGAVFSSGSPDFGHKGILDRFGQIEPKILVATNCYYYKGKRIDLTERIQQLVADLPSLECVIVVPYEPSEQVEASAIHEKAVHLKEALTFSADSFTFKQLPFYHPVYIMFSSGTTGLPKCMVQGPGVLLNHLKEHLLHGDLRPEDTIFYFTTCGWMMWNWLVSALAVGSRLVLYDGNPFYPGPEVLWQLAEREKINTFGISAKYISALDGADARPADAADLSSIKAILSTGSPLSEDGFDFVYDHVKKDVRLSSISGGTDLNGCFALGNPMLPVYRGQIQCPGLGMNVHVYNEEGKSLKGEAGELVCGSPFPSMPLHFYNDTDGKKYHAAYFEKYPGIWRHGDYCLLTDEGGMVIYGRSDATLNPQGVRIGTAEIYRVIEALAEVDDSLAVGQSWQNDERVILFVKLAQNTSLDENLISTIKKTIRDGVSPRHVPSKVLAIADIPYTKNMKKVEIAVKNVINGRPVTNLEALANPESLKLYENLEALQS